MKEKLMKVKDKIVDIAKKVYHVLKTHYLVTTVITYAIIALILILVAIFALKEFVISVCVLIIIEAAMAALLHKAQIWKHGILLVAQIVAAIIIKRIPLMIILVLAYVAATVALQIMSIKKEDKSPKA